MHSLINKIIRSKALALGYLIFISFLFFLPGSALPKENWFGRIHLDKWIHVSLFSILVFIFSFAFRIFKPSAQVLLFISALLYGTVIEWVQDRFIQNRGFDVYDILADGAGAVLGLLLAGWYKKNKPL
jgi:VanZ family protein